MNANIMTVHAQDAFSDYQQAKQVIDVIGSHLPTAAVVTEAWAEGHDRHVAEVADVFRSIGYAVVRGVYDDNDGRQDRHGIMGLVRNTILTDRRPEVVRLGNRNGVYLPLANPASGETYDIYGVHFDDRHEARRLGQVDALLARADASRPTIVAGKYNAMYRHDPLAVALRSIGPVVRRLPAVEPGPGPRPSRLERAGSLGARLTEMAAGSTVRRMEQAGFTDADQQHRPTKGPFNLDRIMYRGLALQVSAVRREKLFKDQRSLHVTLDNIRPAA